MAYTPSANKTKTQGYASNFSNLQNDASRNALTGLLGNRILTNDATATAVTSPVSMAGATTLTLNVPADAAQIIISPQTNSVGVSEDSTAGQYFLQPGNTAQAYDVANQATVTLKSTTTTSVSFYFSII
jgi:hypothetical protein